MKPFIKWVGGKSSIIDNIISKIPKEFENYHEFFLGGGSVLLNILDLKLKNKIKINNKIYAYDINNDLINVYKNIQNNKEELYSIAINIITEYDKLDGTIINKNPLNMDNAKTSKESYYYWLRKKYNNIDKNSIECSALFIILNKLCFRGLYRCNSNGLFNVPFGHYKKTPSIITKKYLEDLSILIADVNFICCDFTEAIKNVKENDFIYLDPPYFPENTTSFVSYTSDGFNIEKHKKLFDILKNIKNIKFLLSNSNTDEVKNNLSMYNIEYIICKRAIHCKKPDTKTLEIVIYNYLIV
jgi:DNA adenine methylase